MAVVSFYNYQTSQILDDSYRILGLLGRQYNNEQYFNIQKPWNVIIFKKRGQMRPCGNLNKYFDLFNINNVRVKSLYLIDNRFLFY